MPVAPQDAINRTLNIFRQFGVPGNVMYSKPVLNPDQTVTVYGMNADGTYSHRVDLYENGGAYYTNVNNRQQVYLEPENALQKNLQAMGRSFTETTQEIKESLNRNPSQLSDIPIATPVSVNNRPQNPAPKAIPINMATVPAQEDTQPAAPRPTENIARPAESKPPAQPKPVQAKPKETKTDIDISSSFAQYMSKEHGLTHINVPQPVGRGLYHCSGRDRQGKQINITFDIGTIPDGTYNIFRSVGAEHEELQPLGIIRPKPHGDYGIEKKIPVRVKSEEPEDAKKKDEGKDKNSGAKDNPKENDSDKPDLKKGKISIHLVRQNETGADSQGSGGVENGKIIICKNNIIVGEYDYQSGPYKKGSAPNMDKYEFTSGEISPFFYEKNGEITSQLGLRISNSTFSGTGRGGILIHCDLGVTGTIGCFGIAPDDWQGFKEQWESIPKSKRPMQMLPLSEAQYVSRKENSRSYADSETPAVEQKRTTAQAQSPNEALIIDTALNEAANQLTASLNYAGKPSKAVNPSELNNPAHQNIKPASPGLS